MTKYVRKPAYYSLDNLGRSRRFRKEKARKVKEQSRVHKSSTISSDRSDLYGNQAQEDLQKGQNLDI